MDDAYSLGFDHFLSQSDPVTRTLQVILGITSAISWSLVLFEGLSQVVRQRRSRKFLALF